MRCQTVSISMFYNSMFSQNLPLKWWGHQWIVCSFWMKIYSYLNNNMGEIWSHSSVLSAYFWLFVQALFLAVSETICVARNQTPVNCMQSKWKCLTHYSNYSNPVNKISNLNFILLCSKKYLSGNMFAYKRFGLILLLHINTKQLFSESL